MGFSRLNLMPYMAENIKVGNQWTNFKKIIKKNKKYLSVRLLIITRESRRSNYLLKLVASSNKLNQRARVSVILWPRQTSLHSSTLIVSKMHQGTSRNIFWHRPNYLLQPILGNSISQTYFPINMNFVVNLNL